MNVKQALAAVEELLAKTTGKIFYRVLGEGDGIAIEGWCTVCGAKKTFQIGYGDEVLHRALVRFQDKHQHPQERS